MTSGLRDFEENEALLSERRIVLDKEGPQPIARINYGKDWTKGEAWADLVANPPTLKTSKGPFRPLFEPLPNQRPLPPGATERKMHPYRKAHTEEHWSWVVSKWIPGEAKSKRRPRPERPRSSRYDRIMDDDWLPSV